jgi:hypothetical protein
MHRCSTMKQLELLTIRKQPIQPEPKIPSRVIREYVRQNLRGFARRQANRERQRQADREARKNNTPRTKKKKEAPTMRSIKVTYRAMFEQPIGVLNPMGLKLPGPQPVEIYKQGAEWKARELSTAKRRQFEKLGKFSSLDDAQESVSRAFEEVKTSWQIWGVPPGMAVSSERELTPAEICDLGDGTAGWYTAEDRTHILHAPSIPPGARIPPTACGETVPAKCFINNRANVEPTCPKCAEVWRKEYKHR